jgi:phage gpG-like protein
MAGRGHKTKIVARPVMGMGMRQERGLGDLLINEIRALQ